MFFPGWVNGLPSVSIFNIMVPGDFATQRLYYKIVWGDDVKSLLQNAINNSHRICHCHHNTISWQMDRLMIIRPRVLTLQWRHNGCDSVSNHHPHDCLLNHLFRRRSKKTSKLRVTGICVVNSPGTGEFPAQMASNAENVSIWWRHHDTINLQKSCALFWFGTISCRVTSLAL